MTKENDTAKKPSGEGKAAPSAAPGASAGASASSAAPPPQTPLDRFAQTFESSARRWEMIVYPSMFAFIIVAAYGFFLIYSVTRDMSELARNIDPAMHTHMKMMANGIAEMTKNVATITANMNQMTSNVESMDATVGTVNASIAEMQSDMADMSGKIRALEPMLVNVSGMNKSMHVINQSVLSMAANTDKMSRDVGATSYQFVRPMSAINSFFPW